MPIYDVHVICDQCSHPHSTSVRVSIDDEIEEGTNVTDYFDQKPLPGAIVFMQSNKYRCPHTKQLFPATDLSLATLHSVH